MNMPVDDMEQTLKVLFLRYASSFKNSVSTIIWKKDVGTTSLKELCLPWTSLVRCLYQTTSPLTKEDHPGTETMIKAWNPFLP